MTRLASRTNSVPFRNCTTASRESPVEGKRLAKGVTMNPNQAPQARRIHVRYRFRGAGAELTDTFPLRSGETTLLHGVITAHRRFTGRAPALFRLSGDRLCLLIHYLFRPDQGFEFPRGSLMNIERMTRVWGPEFYRFHYRSNAGYAHLDIGGARFHSPTMGRATRLALLLESLGTAWGSDAPGATHL